MNAIARHRAARGREARDFALEVRRQRARLRARIEGGEETLQQIVRDTPRWMRSCRLVDVLPWVPGVGSVGVDQVLDATGIDPWAELGRLSVRERLALIEQLDARSGL